MPLRRVVPMRLRRWNACGRPTRWPYWRRRVSRSSIRQSSWGPQPCRTYLIAAIWTDLLWACQNRYFAADFAANTQVWVYEFAHRYGPGLTAIPGYVWGAGHAAELPYLWPSFDNGKPIAPTFSAGERELASQLVAYWSAFVKRGDPAVPWQPRWSSFTDRTSLLSLDVGRSRQLPLEKFERRQQCGFWDALFA